MDEIRNPFSPGAGTKPPELAGRDQILSDAKTALIRAKLGKSPQSLMLLGLRGTGKTVLLNQIEEFANQEDYIAALLEAPEGEALAELLYPEMLQTLRQLSSVETAKAMVQKALAALSSFASVFKVKYDEFEVSVDASKGIADSGRIQRDLPEMFELIGRAALAAGCGWALLIDEVQYLKNDELSALISALHRINQKGLPVVIVAGGLPQIARLAGDAKSYAERLFIYPPVSALSKVDTMHAIRAPLENEGVNINDDALEELVKQTGGYPFFIQEWGYQVWNEAKQSPIALDDVKAAARKASNRLDEGFFRIRLERITQAENEFVAAMASLGQGPFLIADVAKTMKRDLQSLGKVRADLISKGMIYSPARGEIDFTVPQFDSFLKRTL